MKAEQYNLHEPRRPITGLEKRQEEIYRVIHNFDMKKAPLLCIAALKSNGLMSYNFVSICPNLATTGGHFDIGLGLF